MIDLVQSKFNYPNPQRLFIELRDTWFNNLIDSLEIPITTFTTIRSSQLGQLLLPIQSNRAKMIRAGEEPGPGILEYETVSSVVPTYQVISELNKIFDEKWESNANDFSLMSDQFDLHNFKSKISSVDFKMNEWNDMKLSNDRLDEIYAKSLEIFNEILLLAIQTQYSLDQIEETIGKLKTESPVLSTSLFSLFDVEGQQSIENLEDLWNQETNQRIISIKNEEEVYLSAEEFQGKTLSSYLFLNELYRVLEAKTLSFDFNNLESIISLEMLIKIPYPEKSFLPIIRNYLFELKKVNNNGEFYDLILNFYQIYSNGISQTNPRVFMRMYKSVENKFKELVRAYWRNYKSNEPTLPVLWSTFSSSIVQLNNKITNTPDIDEFHKQTLSMLKRLEQHFWRTGMTKLESVAKSSKIGFWGYIASIGTRQLNSAKDALDNFHKLDSVISSIKIFKDESDLEDLDIYVLDRYSLLQKIISYGLESRSHEIFNTVKSYTDKLNILLKSIKKQNIAINIDIDKEIKAVEDIYNFIQTSIDESQ